MIRRRCKYTNCEFHTRQVPCSQSGVEYGVRPILRKLEGGF